MTDLQRYYDQSYPPSLWEVVPPPAPTLVSLTPNTVIASAPAQLITVAGTGFTIASVINIDDAPVATTFVNETTVTTSYDPTLPATVQFTVKNGLQTSNALPFTVTAGTQQEPESFAAIPVDRSDMPDTTDTEST